MLTDRIYHNAILCNLMLLNCSMVANGLKCSTYSGETGFKPLPCRDLEESVSLMFYHVVLCALQNLGRRAISNTVAL